MVGQLRRSLEAIQARLTERCLFVLTAIAALLLLLIPAWPLLTRRVPLYLDLGLFHLPIRAFYSRCLAEGRSFDWVPQLYGGMFLSGEGEHGPYHPLHLLLYRCLPLDVAFALEAFLHVPLLLAGMFAFLRRYVRGTAALLGAVCYAFCSGSVLHNIYPNYQGVLAHLPWILLLLDVAAATSAVARRRLALSAVALLTGSQLLLGSPQALSYSLFTEALFVLFLAWYRRPGWTFWPSWLAANLLGLAIGGIQVLATRALLADSTRGSFDPLLGSLLPSQLAQLLAPDLLSKHLPAYACSECLYFGAVPLVLGLWWVSLGGWDGPQSGQTCVPTRSVGTRELGLFALALGVLSAWLALGKYGYLYYLQTWLPLVGQFRLPMRYFTLTALAASILAAVAFDRLLAGVRTGQQTAWRRLWLPWAGVAAALLLAIVFRIAYPKENGSSIHRNYFAGALFLGGAALALTAAARGRTIGLFALVALAIIDIEVFSLKAPFWPGESPWDVSATLAEFTARAESPPPHSSPPPSEGKAGWRGRWLDDAFELPQPLLFGQAVVEGYRGGLEPRKRLVYRSVDALRLANTAWHHLSRWSKPIVLPGLRRVSEFWYAVPDPLPRVRLVSRTQVSDAPAADIHNIDLETTALVTHPLLPSGGRQPPVGESGTACLIQDQPGELTVRVAAPGRRLLIVADSFDPSWRATIDDRPVTVERVNGDFLGCVVEGGEHEVHFVFRPPSIRYGRFLSLGGLGMVLLIAGVSAVQMLIQSRRAAGAPGWARLCG
jgi:hypothetical protein